MSERKALAHVAEAEKKLNSSGFFAMFSGGNKYSDAAREYNNAASQYKACQNWDKAGECHALEGKIYDENLKNALDATEAYLNAAKAFKNTSPSEAVKWYKIVAMLYVDNNRFSPAAKVYKEVATLEEGQLNFKEALSAWKSAADYYQAADSPAHMNSCLLKVADLAAQEEQDYKRAYTLYETISEKATQGAAWSVSTYLFKATLCRWVDDIKSGADVDENSFTQFERYCDMYPKFADSKECKVLEEVVTAWREDSPENYSKALFVYNKRYSRLNGWTSDMFIIIQKALRDGIDAVTAEPGEEAAVEDEFR